jgi:hypothetical protein
MSDKLKLNERTQQGREGLVDMQQLTSKYINSCARSNVRNKVLYSVWVPVRTAVHNTIKSNVVHRIRDIE